MGFAVRLVGIYEKIHYYERQLLPQESIGSCRAPVAVVVAKDCIIYLAATGNQKLELTDCVSAPSGVTKARLQQKKIHKKRAIEKGNKF